MLNFHACSDKNTRTCIDDGDNDDNSFCPGSTRRSRWKLIMMVQVEGL